MAGRGPITLLLARMTRGLRFPQLFLLIGALFLLDVLIPDLIPFADELFLGLLTALLGSWKRDRPSSDEEPAEPPTRVIDVE